MSVKLVVTLQRRDEAGMVRDGASSGATPCQDFAVVVSNGTSMSVQSTAAQTKDTGGSAALR